MGAKAEKHCLDLYIKKKMDRKKPLDSNTEVRDEALDSNTEVRDEA